MFLKNQISKNLELIDYLRKLVIIKEDELKDLCPHNSKKRKRENGLYGESYMYCSDCNLEF